MIVSVVTRIKLLGLNTVKQSERRTVSKPSHLTVEGYFLLVKHYVLRRMDYVSTVAGIDSWARIKYFQFCKGTNTIKHKGDKPCE